MRSALYLAWRYLAAHPVKTAILTLSITLIVFVPLGLRVLVVQSERQLRARAEATPLLAGTKGSPTELTLNSLYFGRELPETMPHGQVDRIRDTGFALAVPLYVRFRAETGDEPIVGTTLDYFDVRGLRIADGRLMARLGDCVLGSRVAERRGIGPGDHVLTRPESVFDLAGVYPLKMKVTGVLARSGGPDDDAVFTDVRTAWVIQGLAHGHEDLSRPEAADRVLNRDGRVYVGNASVREWTEVTDENVDSFHFHGDPGSFPITGILAYPYDAKSATLLRGRFLGPDERYQILRPTDVVDELMATVFTVQGFVVAALALVGGATLATAALVFALSVRLRRREIRTMIKIGGSRGRIAGILVAEVVAVVLAGALIAAGLAALTDRLAPEILRALIS